MGIINTFQGETVSAILMYEKAKKYVSKENKYKVEINSSISYRHIGEYMKSAEALIKIINLFNENKTENARIKTYALFFKETTDIDKTIEYFEQLEDYGKKEGDTYICQFSIKERIEIYKKLKNQDGYNKLVQKFYKNELDMSKINNKQYEFHLNNKIKEEEITIMRKTSTLIIISNLFLIGIIILVYKKMKKSKYESMKDPLCNVYNRLYLELYKKM